MTNIPPIMPMRQMTRVLFFAYEGFQLLDITGPASVFAEAEESDTQTRYDVVVASFGGGLVRSSSGVAIATECIDALRIDQFSTLIVPGAAEASIRSIISTGELPRWVAANASKASRLCSICTGAFILAAAGQLQGRQVTTHWMATKRLAKAFPDVQVQGNALYVRDGHIWTSAGVSTGIDMALALLEDDFGRETATRVARKLVLQSRRPGHQSQFSTLLKAQGGAYATLIDWMADNLEADLSLDALAARAAQSSRTFHRKFTRDTGLTPAAMVESLRLNRARALLEAGESVTSAAFLAGFRTLDHLGRCFVRQLGLSPSQYRTLHSSKGRAP